MTSRLVTELTIPGTPRSKQRPRSRPGGGRLFTPRETLEAELVVRTAWIMANEAGLIPDYDYTAPMKIDLIFYRPTLRRVDVDNLAKLVTDALNRVAFADDSQIEDMHIRRVLDRENPRTELRLYILE